MMIAGVQLVVHSPLLNVQFPGNAFVIYEELIGMVTYEFLPTSDIFPDYFHFPSSGSLNDRFERLDYGSFYSIMLLGCIFLVIVWMLLLYVVYLLLLSCCKFQWPKKVLRYLRKTLFWKQWIVFTYATFLELFICSLIQAKISHEDWLYSKSVFASFLIWILVMVLIFYLLIVSFCIVLPKYAREGKTEAHMKKYSVILDEMNDKRGYAPMLVHISYYSRRIALAIVCIFWNEKPLF